MPIADFLKASTCKPKMSSLSHMIHEKSNLHIQNVAEWYGEN